MSIRQRINALLWPITGLDLDPVTPQGDDVVLGDDLETRLSWLVGKSPTGSTLVEATSDGALKVADTGSGLELVEVSSGMTTDTLTDLGLTKAFSEVAITVKLNPIQITYETSSGTYSSAIELPLGTHIRSMSADDIQVASAIAGNPCVYDVEAYR